MSQRPTLNATEALLAAASRILFWSLIGVGLLNSIASIIVDLTPSNEAVPQWIQACTMFLMLFLSVQFFLFVALGTIRLRGSSGDIRVSDFLLLLLFLSITILPLSLWTARSAIASTPIGMEAVSGWTGWTTLIALSLGLALQFELQAFAPRAADQTNWLTILISQVSLPFSSVRFIRSTLVGAWEERARSRWARIDNRSVADLRGARSKVFVDDALLNMFQDTALTRRYEPRVIADVPEFQQLAETLKQRQHIAILDIGGGEGVASAELIGKLLQLMGRTDVQIVLTLFETEDRKALYAQHLERAFPGRVALTFGGLLEQESELGRYDLIIALHSLYALADSTRDTDHWSGPALLLQKLQASLTQDGKIVASLASGSGVSAAYKRLCMQELFGRVVQDFTFEELIETWRPTSRKIVDSYFLFSSNERGWVTREMAVAWVKYFVRIRNDALTKRQERYLVESLMVRLMAFHDLPQDEQIKLRQLKLSSEEMLSRTQLLPHKTGILVMGRDV